MSLNKKNSDQRFSTRWGFLLSALGIAIGTGNIWRFPRIVAQNGSDHGGGAFILTWVIFLFLWSVPLIIAEYAVGINTRKGVIGAVMATAGKKFAWIGSFMTFVATAITFFYSVIVGWCLYYFAHTLFNELPASTATAMSTWENYQSGGWPLVSHAIVMILGGLAIWKGVSSIEKINKLLIPILLVIILIALIRSLTLPGSMQGIKYLFTIDWHQFKDPNIWVAALTQNAWDTGAGWGMFITYGAYMEMKFGIVKNALITGIGNNLISLVSGIMIFGTCFAIMGSQMGNSNAEVLGVMKNSGPASTGLTFIWIPQLFEKILFGKPLTILFFLGLTLAGFTSLISQLELTVRTFIDGGMKRPAAIVLLIAISYLFGIPSAMNLSILTNQDFVWGLALLLSGGLFAFVITKFRASKIRTEILDQNPEDIKPGRFWDVVITWFVPVASVLLLSWWLINDGMNNEWYNPFASASLMTTVLQWGIVISVLLVINKWVTRKNENKL
ncbi:MAG: sodium-dependent transporter [Chitinophagaceae bacterium]